MTTIDPSYPLTPSEVILLNPERFIKSSALGYRPVGSEIKVNVNNFAQLLAAGVLLAMEAAGEIQLELEEYKRLIGKGKRIKITPLKEKSSFPEPSLEAVFLGISEYLASSKKGANVRDLLWAAVGEDDDHPWNKFLDSIPPHLAARNLVGSREEKKLKIFTVTHYDVPDETWKLAQDGPIDALKDLLDTCEAERKDFWKRLKKDIYRGISARDSSDDGDFDD